MPYDLNTAHATDMEHCTQMEGCLVSMRLAGPAANLDFMAGSSRWTIAVAVCALMCMRMCSFVCV